MNRDTCPGTRHGTMCAYTRYGCRCDDAREDWRLYRKRRREGRAEPRKVTIDGMSRRVRALMAIGYTCPHIGEVAGLPTDTVKSVGYGRNKSVYKATADKIVVAYSALCMTPGPDRRTERWARKRGYAPPLAWDDDTIDDPAATPEGMEKVRRYGVLPPPEELRWLIAGGESQLSIARRFRVQPAAVERALLRDRRDREAA